VIGIIRGRSEDFIMNCWLYYYRFEVESGDRHRFKDKFECLAGNDTQAWVQVASSLGSQNPPVDTVKLVEKQWLMDKPQEEILEIVNTIRNH
jgi:hypothetical protein